MNGLWYKFSNQKPLRKILIGAGLLLASGLAVFLLWPRQAQYIVAVPRSYIPSLLLSGEVVAIDNSAVTAAVSSTIQELRVRKGERVARGELLAVLDSAQAESAVAQAQASLDYSRNHLDQASQNEAYDNNDAANQRQQAEARVAEADLRLEQARHNLEQEQADCQRDNTLYQAGALSRQDYEQSLLQLESVQNAAALAEKEAELARLVLESIQDSASDVAMLESEVRQKEAAVQAAANSLEDYCLYAPAEGQVTDIYKMQGEMLAAGDILLNISSTGRTRILIQPDQRYSSLIQPGTRAEVWSQAEPDQRLPGRIVYVKPFWDAQEGTLEAEIELDESGFALSPGAIVTVQLLASESRQAIIIPQNYLGSLNNISGVWVYRGGKLAFAPVTTAEGNENGIIIQSGIEYGDMVVFPGNYSEGQELSLVEDSSYQASS